MLFSLSPVSYTHLCIKEDTRKVVVTGIEMFRKLLDEAQAGDNIGALLRGVQRNEIERSRCIHPSLKATIIIVN